MLMVGSRFLMTGLWSRTVWVQIPAPPPPQLEDWGHLTSLSLFPHLQDRHGQNGYFIVRRIEGEDACTKPSIVLNTNKLSFL